VSVQGGEEGNYDSVNAAKRAKTWFDVAVQVWRPVDAVADALTTKLADEIVAVGSHGFSPKLVSFVEPKEASAIVSVRGGIGEAGSLWGLELDGVNLPVPEDSFNPMIKTLFGDVLSNLNIDVIHGLNHWLTPKTGGGFQPNTSPGNMLCSFVLLVDNRPSPINNRMYMKKFLVDDNHVMTYNDKFYPGHKIFRNSNGNVLGMMELAAMIPDWGFVLLRETSTWSRLRTSTITAAVLEAIL
jgi:hypothetical protein